MSNQEYIKYIKQRTLQRFTFDKRTLSQEPQNGPKVTCLLITNLSQIDSKVFLVEERVELVIETRFGMTEAIPFSAGEKFVQKLLQKFEYTRLFGTKGGKMFRCYYLH